MVPAARACAPPPTLSSVSAIVLNDHYISCFFSFPSLFSFRLARFLLPFAFSRFFRYRALSLSGAPRLQVRRACAPVLGIRKSVICESFRYPLVNLEETKYFGPSRDGLNTPSFDVQYFSLHHFVRSLGFYSFLGGRRKLPQAGEVRRPRGAGVVSLLALDGSSAPGLVRTS